MENRNPLRSKASSLQADLEQRVKVSLALQRYLRAIERFESASNEFNEACRSLRGGLSPNSRFITSISYQYYLVTSDEDGNFEVEQIESV